MRGLIFALTIGCLISAINLASNAQAYVLCATSVQGTTQMAGEWAEIGKEYTLGVEDPMNFELRSVEFVASRVIVGEDIFAPKADEKMLVIHYTIHNPQSEERNASWNTFNFTVVDATNQNAEFSQYVGQEDNSLEIGSINLKPAQEIKVYTFFIVPAKGVIPKLIVKRPDGLVLRYDLKDKVTPLPAPYADPSDSTGATALKEVPWPIGSYCPIGKFDIKFDSAMYTDETYVEYSPEEGTHHLLLNVTIKNPSSQTQTVYWSTFNPGIKTAGGETIAYNQYLLHAKRDEVLEAELEPGQEVRGRFFFQVYKDDPAAKLLVREGPDDDNGRLYSFDVSGIE
jgi:hypothetical protein